MAAACGAGAGVRLRRRRGFGWAWDGRGVVCRGRAGVLGGRCHGPSNAAEAKERGRNGLTPRVVATTGPAARRTSPTGYAATEREQRASRREDGRWGHSRGENFQGKCERDGNERGRESSASAKRAAGASTRRKAKHAIGAGDDVNGGRAFPWACGRNILYAIILNTGKNKKVSFFAPLVFYLINVWPSSPLPQCVLLFDCCMFVFFGRRVCLPSPLFRPKQVVLAHHLLINKHGGALPLLLERRCCLCDALLARQIRSRQTPLSSRKC